ncbi:hypothetical protein RV02_GL001212 [Enterococcus gilvus]|nr:hypothetical protein RV02_GL001212 [Enterococcus gilvus]
MERSGMSEFMVSYSVEENPNRVLNSDLRQSKVVEAQNEDEARKKLYEIETRKINYISSITIFTWNGENRKEKA